MDWKAEQLVACATLTALGMHDAIVTTFDEERHAAWRLAVRLQAAGRYVLALRPDGVWVVNPNMNWRNPQGDELPTLQQAVAHYLLTHP